MPAIALPDPPLSDGTVTLRGFESSDVSALTAACQDPEIPRWTLVPSPYTEEHARGFIADAPQRRASGRGAPFAIVDAEDTLLGAIALTAIDWEQRAADIGYWVAAGARRRGIAGRALALITRWSFESLGLTRMEIRTQIDNRASQAVARRAGFSPVRAPLVRRPECDHLPDVFFARLRG